MILVIEPGNKGIGMISHTAEELVTFSVGNARKNGWIGNLITVQVKNRQHNAIGKRIHELVRLPAGCKRPGLRLAVAHYGNGQK